MWASLVAKMIKNSSAVQETWVKSLDWEDPLEKGTATDSHILLGEFHGQNLAGYSPRGHAHVSLSLKLTKTNARFQAIF